MMSPRHLAAAFALAPAALVPAPALAQLAQAPVLDTTFVRHLAQMARQRAAQLATPPAQPENPRVTTQYRDALSDLERGAYGEAATSLLAVLQRAPQNPLYRGDLAYAYLRLGQLAQDSLRQGLLNRAGTEYTRAYQGQQQNGWYILGIASVRAAQRQFADAAGAADLAAQTDSSIVDGVVASAAAGWFEAAGDRTRALAWARIAVQKAPDDAIDWLRIAVYLRARDDTSSEGLSAIRHYLALRPGDKTGSALYAMSLFDIGQVDSSLALAESAAQDSSLREYAAEIYLHAGRRLLGQRDIDRALQVLEKGQAWAGSSQHASYSLFIGRGQLIKVSSALSSYEESHTCDWAHAADSLTSSAERNMRAGILVDSARTQALLDNVLPQYKANSQAALRGCQNAPSSPRPSGQRPAPRPAPRPRRP